MSFFNELTGNLNSVKNNLSEITTKITESSKQLKNLAKLKMDFMKSKSELKKLQSELGKYLYDLVKNNREEDLLFVNNLVEKIDIELSRQKSLEIQIKNFKDFSNDFSYKENYDNNNSIGIESSKEEVVYYDERDLK